MEKQLTITINVNGLERTYQGDFDMMNNIDWAEVMYNHFNDV